MSLDELWWGGCRGRIEHRYLAHVSRLMYLVLTPLGEDTVVAQRCWDGVINGILGKFLSVQRFAIAQEQDHGRFHRVIYSERDCLPQVESNNIWKIYVVCRVA